MKRIGLLALSLIAGSCCFVQVAEAKGCRPMGVNAREARQQRRIAAGVSNGSLTDREAYRMEKQQNKLNRQEYRMRHDNNPGLQPRERARLEREENHSSTHIYEQKHDANNR